MIKALFYFACLAALVFGGVWVAQRPGTIGISWLGYDITVHVGFFLVLLILALFVLFLAFRLLSLFFSLPRRALAFRRKRLAARGFRALSRGMSALACGDSSAARRAAQEIADYLPDAGPMALLIEAQAGRIDGDHAGARRNFDALMQDKDTAMLGLRGMMVSALDEGDRASALGHACAALARHPKQGWLLRTTYQLQLSLREWESALATLEKALRHKAVDKDEGRIEKAVLHLAIADDLPILVSSRQPETHIEAAWKLAPDYLPVAIRYIGLLVSKKKRRKAVSVIERVWKVRGHPELLAFWEQLAPNEKKYRPGQSKRMHWYERLVAVRPDSYLAQAAAARAAFDLGFWGEARAYLRRAEELGPTPDLYKLWAVLEEKTGQGEDAVQHRLSQAAEAPAGKVWVCRETGRIYARWAPVAEPHGSFNTIVWDFPRRYTEADGDETGQIQDGTAAIRIGYRRPSLFAPDVL